MSKKKPNHIYIKVIEGRSESIVQHQLNSLINTVDVQVQTLTFQYDCAEKLLICIVSYQIQHWKPRGPFITSIGPVE